MNQCSVSCPFRNNVVDVGNVPIGRYAPWAWRIKFVGAVDGQPYSIDVERDKAAEAIAPLTQVMNNSKDAELKQIARLRLARILIDQGKPDDAIKTLAQGTPGSFAGRYHEVHGDALYAKKDIPGAVAEYNQALGSSDGGADAALLQLKLADLASNEKAKPSNEKANPPNEKANP